MSQDQTHNLEAKSRAQCHLDPRINVIFYLINTFIYECAVSDDCLKSVTVNMYKENGNALDTVNYCVIKFLDQLMKIMERDVERFKRERVSSHDM